MIFRWRLWSISNLNKKLMGWTNRISSMWWIYTTCSDVYCLAIFVRYSSISGLTWFVIMVNVMNFNEWAHILLFLSSSLWILAHRNHILRNSAMAIRALSVWTNTSCEFQFLMTECLCRSWFESSQSSLILNSSGRPKLFHSDISLWKWKHIEYTKSTEVISRRRQTHIQKVSMGERKTARRFISTCTYMSSELNYI